MEWYEECEHYRADKSETPRCARRQDDTGMLACWGYLYADVCTRWSLRQECGFTKAAELEPCTHDDLRRWADGAYFCAQCDKKVYLEGQWWDWYATWGDEKGLQDFGPSTYQKCWRWVVARGVPAVDVSMHMQRVPRNAKPYRRKPSPTEPSCIEAAHHQYMHTLDRLHAWGEAFAAAGKAMPRKCPKFRTVCAGGPQVVLIDEDETGRWRGRLETVERDRGVLEQPHAYVHPPSGHIYDCFGTKAQVIAWLGERGVPETECELYMRRAEE